MTIQEMRQQMIEKCETFPLCSDNGGCPLFNNHPGFLSCNLHKDEYVTKFYDQMMGTTNPYWENITKLANKQRKKGLETYGMGIECNPADVVTRIQYIEEELIDALMYLEWVKDGMRDEYRKQEI